MSVAGSKKLLSAKWGGGLRLGRVVVATLAAAVFVSVVCTLAPTAQALASVEYKTFTGTDRYQTSVLVSEAGFDPGVEALVIADGSDYRTATCSAPLAAVYGGPTLLTPPGFLDARVLDEAVRLNPAKIFVVGLGSAVVRAVRSAFPEVDTSGSIIALSGADAYKTAGLVAAEVASKVGGVSGAILVPGDEALTWAGYVAVSVSPLAAAKGWPILFTPASGLLPDATAQALDSLGAPLVVEVATTVGTGIAEATIRTLAGTDQYDTCALVAEFAVSEGLSYEHVAVVSGYDGECSMGLAVGPYLALDGGVALVVGSSDVPGETATLIGTNAGKIQEVDFSGAGPEACAWVEFILGGEVPAGFVFSKLAQGSEGKEVLYLEGRLTALSYRPGPIDGVFNKRTRQAVIAFQKWEGLKRTGIVVEETWAQLVLASRPVPKMESTGTWIEIDKTRQVLMYCVDGAVERALTTSTGSASVGFVTPSGEYQVMRENTWETYRYHPLYLRRGGVWAIHGYSSVPVHPASHGCIRIPIWDMEELHALVPIGTKVYIY
jgi:N-acetylmuramoyl-L-alanine amidase